MYEWDNGHEFPDPLPPGHYKIEGRKLVRIGESPLVMIDEELDFDPQDAVEECGGITVDEFHRRRAVAILLDVFGYSP